MVDQAGEALTLSFYGFNLNRLVRSKYFQDISLVKSWKKVSESNKILTG
jgi:hypothetical protein